MTKAFALDLKKLQARAFDRAEWAEEALRRYHAAIPDLNVVDARPLRALYDWMFVPPTLWPFNVQDVLEDCLAVLEKGKRLNSRHRLLIELLPEPPDESICAAVADHELHVQKGIYENLVKTQAKYSQNELAIRTNPQLRHQWTRIKATFNVQAYRDYKGVIRRTMSAERNLRPSFLSTCVAAKMFFARRSTRSACAGISMGCSTMNRSCSNSPSTSRLMGR
jgi:hypothetical protein